jgi:hypothetical protein
MQWAHTCVLSHRAAAHARWCEHYERGANSSASDEVVAHASACMARYMTAERSAGTLKCVDSANAAAAAASSSSSVPTAGWDK